jgi:hypothetical protein
VYRNFSISRQYSTECKDNLQSCTVTVINNIQQNFIHFAQFRSILFNFVQFRSISFSFVQFRSISFNFVQFRSISFNFMISVLTNLNKFQTPTSNFDFGLFEFESETANVQYRN